MVITPVSSVLRAECDEPEGMHGLHGGPGRPDVRSRGRSYQLGEEHGRPAFTRATVHTPKNIRGVAQFSGASKRIKFVTLPGI